MPSDPLEIRAKRGLVRKLWFETPTIGIFKELVTATNISPEEVLHHIKNAGKNNARMQTYLKPRHLELTRILYFEGMSYQKIADCLSNLEGFAIDPSHLRDLSGVTNQDVPEEKKPQLYQTRKKELRVVGNTLELFIRDNQKKEQVFARITINASNDRESSSLQSVHNEAIHFLDPHARAEIIKQLIQRSFSPKQIAEALSAYQGFFILETEVTNEANKLQSSTLPHPGRGAKYPFVHIQREKDRLILLRKNDVFED